MYGLRKEIKRKFDLETFKDSLLASNHTETLISSELIVCSRTSIDLLVYRILVSSANSRN